MTDDNDDPVMARIFDRAFASVEVPPLKAIRARRARRWGRPLAAALVLVAVIVISGAIGGWLDGRRAPVAGPTLVVTTEVPPSAAPATTPCPVTNRHDAAGVAVSSGDIGLVEIRPGSFPGEKLIVLVRRGAAIGDSLELHATAVGPFGGGDVVWSTPATARTTTWGTVVFEVNSKPIGNVGCWRLTRLDAPAGDPGPHRVAPRR